MKQSPIIEMLREALLCARAHGVTFDIFRDDIGQAALTVVDEALNKSRPDLDQLLAECVAAALEMSPSEREAMWEAQQRSWVVGELMLTNPDISRDEAERRYEAALRKAARQAEDRHREEEAMQIARTLARAGLKGTTTGYSDEF
jgi:hypothetical protein